LSSRQIAGPISPEHKVASSSELALCEGFRVESSDGYVGVVQALRYAPSTRWDCPSELAVYAGRLTETLLIISSAEVKNVSLEYRRVVLRSSPRVTATERVSAARD
jgi:hypothetical protein